jgi:glycosyltransferase involved in cell wall biosynthesis
MACERRLDLTREHCLAVLGQRDEPTDAVEEYCQYLVQGLAKHGIELTLLRLPWKERGWADAFRELQEKMRKVQVGWVIVQYTALAWSQRGFPTRAAAMLRVIKDGGTRCAVVFHDPVPYEGERLVDSVRRSVQLGVMRKVVRAADLSVLTIPPETITWLPRETGTVRFIPVGANLPHPESVWEARQKARPDIPTIAVFSVNGGEAGEREIAQIVEAMRIVESQVGAVRLSVLGRNSETAGPKLKEQLKDTRVDVAVHGLVTAEDVETILGNSDVLLFVRGPISTRRSSALAGVACGLPVVAYEGWETAGPIREAGVVLVERDAVKEAGNALVHVLKDEAYRRDLQERSRRAQRQYFSWKAIGEVYAAALRSGSRI